MKLVSTKRTAAEKKAEKARYDTPCSLGEPDEYPYDTRLTLGKSVLAKLGLSPKDFKVGQKVDVTIVAEVRSLRMAEGKSYDSNEVELQITEIGAEKRAKSMKDAVSDGVKGANDE